MKKKDSGHIRVQFRDANLKRKLRRHLARLGFRKGDQGQLEAPGHSKEIIRSLHAGQRIERLKASQDFIKSEIPRLSKYFASGSDIDPARISPVLERVSSHTLEGALFRLASLTWSVPVSNGFGRRLRYLVWDEHTGKLMGLIAIGDPVFNLSVRDSLIGWDSKERGQRLVNIMDAYVLGAIPPYNMLLGGKLVACLVRSKEIYDDFKEIYGSTKGIISKQEKKARLLAVMTSSSMGRSSIYNRLKLGGVEYFKPLGFTGGWGHFHIPDDLFSDLREYLREIDHPYADRHRFGQGPNWKLRTTRAALTELGFKHDMLRHGIQREVFMCQFATNTMQILKKGTGRPDLSTLLKSKDIGEIARARWLLPRSESRPEYKAWEVKDLLQQLKKTSMPFVMPISMTG